MKDTKERILETAFLLLIKNGYNGVSIGDITNALEITRSLPYRYFASKHDIFFEAFKQYFYDRYFPIGFDYDSISMKDFISHIISRLVDILKNLSVTYGEEVSFFDYNRLYYDAVKYDANFRKYMREEFTKLRKIMTHAIATGEVRSDIPVESYERILLDIWGRCDNIQSDKSNKSNIKDATSDIMSFYNLIKIG